MERLARFRKQVAETVEQLDTWQLVGLGLVGLGTIAALAWIVLSASSEPQRVLYSDLTEESASKIVAELENKQIPYELDGPTSITVPSDRLYEARLHLAGAGLPETEGAGFELFDEAEFGMTSFTQKVNYQRAMENELARTIRALDSVQSTRVHLVMPEDALFEDEQKEPSASVVLTLQRGHTPDKAQIQSVRYLVASAVESLKPAQVTVVDESGSLLARSSGAIGGQHGGEEHFEANLKVERKLEERIQQLLTPLFGLENVQASVNVELDTARVRETREEYNPEKTAVRSEQRSEEKRRQGGEQAAGAPGAASNLPGRAGTAETNGDGGSATVSSEVVNYEISKNVRNITRGGFAIKRLSVAVVLDEANAATAPKPDGEPSESATDDAKSEADGTGDQPDAASASPSKEKVEALVKSAVGFNAERGDRVQVAFETFRRPAPSDVAAPAWYQEPGFLLDIARYALLALLALGLFLFVVRPTIQAVAATASTESEDAELIGQTVGELESQYGMQDSAGQAPPWEERYRQLREEAIELGQSDIDKTGQVIRQWIRADKV